MWRAHVVTETLSPTRRTDESWKETSVVGYEENVLDQSDSGSFPVNGVVISMRKVHDGTSLN